MFKFTEIQECKILPIPDVEQSHQSRFLHICRPTPTIKCNFKVEWFNERKEGRKRGDFMNFND